MENSILDSMKIFNRYNIEKVDWENFDYFLIQRENYIKIELLNLFKNSTHENINLIIEKIQNFLQEATKKFISISKICNKSKR